AWPVAVLPADRQVRFQNSRCLPPQELQLAATPALGRSERRALRLGVSDAGGSEELRYERAREPKSEQSVHELTAAQHARLDSLERGAQPGFQPEPARPCPGTPG